MPTRRSSRPPRLPMIPRALSRPAPNPVLLGAILAALLVSAPALGAPRQNLDLVVRNLNDSGPGSLRAAIEAPGGSRMITFAPGVRGQITFASPLDLEGSDTVIIEGPGLAGLRLSGGDASRLFEVGRHAALKLTDLTISHGRSVGKTVSDKAEKAGPGERARSSTAGPPQLRHVVVTWTTPRSAEKDYTVLTVTDTAARFSTRGRCGSSTLSLSPTSRWAAESTKNTTANVRSGEETQPVARSATKGARGPSRRIQRQQGGRCRRRDLHPRLRHVRDGRGQRSRRSIYDGRGSSSWTSATRPSPRIRARGQHGRWGPSDKAGDAGGGGSSPLRPIALRPHTVVPAVLGWPKPEKPGVLGAGGLELQAGAQMLRSDTIVGAAASTDIGTGTPAPTMNTIVGSCGGAGLRSLGFDLDVHGSCNLSGPTDLRNVDPELAPLADEGGRPGRSGRSSAVRRSTTGTRGRKPSTSGVRSARSGSPTTRCRRVATAVTSAPSSCRRCRSFTTTCGRIRWPSARSRSARPLNPSRRC